MAGLAAAAEARSLGAHPLVLEKLDRPGGSMLLSSGVIWRHREFGTSAKSAQTVTSASSACSSSAWTPGPTGSSRSARP